MSCFDSAGSIHPSISTQEPPPRSPAGHITNDTTWSIISENGGDWQCSPEFNYQLNGLLTNKEISYSFNGYTHTLKKVDPYTVVLTNTTTRKQRTLKSSVCILN